MRIHTAGIASTLIVAIFSLTSPTDCQAFSFTFTQYNTGPTTTVENPNMVARPIGYTSSGGVLNISVGIDPNSQDDGASNTNTMAVAVQNVIRTWNGLVPTTANVISDFVNIPVGEIDFESVLLHEMGHSLGLGHNNLGVQTGVSGSNTEYAAALDGADDSFNFDDGADNIIGTRDDIMGDDVNLNYFRTAGASTETNNPFTIASVVDSTTYSRDLGDLPGTDTASGVSSRDNAGTFVSIANNTEAVMNQGTFNNEIQRTLGHDDVAGILYSQSGEDLVAGTSDDWTLNLTYSGLDDSADIVIDFDNSETGFAVSKSSASISGNNATIVSNKIFFNDTFDWFYNQDSNDASAVPEPASWACLVVLSGIGCIRRRYRS